MAGFLTEIGEAFVGSGAEAAHLNTVLGAKGGPVEPAWVTALATPRSGHAAFVAILQPGIPAKPLTLFVNKAELSGPEHARLTWGPAQAGVAAGVMDAVADGVVDRDRVDDALIIAAVWVNPEARDEWLVFDNNRQATAAALRAGRDRTPSVDEALAARDRPLNAYFLPDWDGPDRGG
ncbi:MAG: formaldehyde-activating enzyme [Acidimicrobiales bacterium]|nr:formaldehyde-activating enzyme [Acidimicrobiales bacterium]